MYNAQGNYNQGRGRDGLSSVGAVSRRAFIGSRFGTGVKTSARPPAISGKPTPPPHLDPDLVLPGATGEGFTSGRYRFTKPAEMSVTIDSATTDPIKITPARARQRQTRPNKATIVRHRQQFINWIKGWAPGIYAAAKKKADMIEVEEGTLGQLGGWWETFTDSVGSVGGQYLQFRTQKEILDAQLERMKQGLPPLQTSEYAPTVAVKPDPGTTREITGAIGAGFGQMLPFIAIGGVALVLLMRRR